MGPPVGIQILRLTEASVPFIFPKATAGVGTVLPLPFVWIEVAVGLMVDLDGCSSLVPLTTPLVLAHYWAHRRLIVRTLLGLCQPMGSHMTLETLGSGTLSVAHLLGTLALLIQWGGGVLYHFLAYVGDATLHMVIEGTLHAEASPTLRAGVFRDRPMLGHVSF